MLGDPIRVKVLSMSEIFLSSTIMFVLLSVVSSALATQVAPELSGLAEILYQIPLVAAFIWFTLQFQKSHQNSLKELGERFVSAEKELANGLRKTAEESHDRWQAWLTRELQLRAEDQRATKEWITAQQQTSMDSRADVVVALRELQTQQITIMNMLILVLSQQSVDPSEIKELFVGGRKD